MEELEESEAIRLEIVRIETIWEGILPAVLVERTVLNRPDSILPLITGLQVYTLNDTSSRESEQSGMLIGKSLSKVATHTVLTILEGVYREETDVLEVYTVLASEEDTKLTLCDGTRRLDHLLILFPFSRCDCDSVGSELLILLHSCTINELHDDLCITFRSSRPYGETIILALMKSDTEESVIRDS